MKGFKFFLIVFLSFSSQAQTWVENNAVWHYDFWNIAMGGFYKISYTNDTLMNGVTAQHLKHERYVFVQNGPGGPIIQNGPPTTWDNYTYQSGDTVFWWDGNQFEILFDFGAQIGDSWMIASTAPSWSDPMCQDTSFVEVVNTGIETINGGNYRFIDLEGVGYSPIGLYGRYIERFGGPGYIFPWYRTCDSMTVAELDMLTFKCFEDDSFSLYNPSGQDCEYYLTHLGASEQVDLSISIYPNPVSRDLHVTLPGEFELIIYDLLGNKMLQMKSLDNIVLDLSQYNNGFYYIDISQNSIMHRKKFVKL